jgi:hypothetical protein
MDDFNNVVLPEALAPILEETVETGAILRTLAAAKPGATILEIGTARARVRASEAVGCWAGRHRRHGRPRAAGADFGKKR